MGIVEKELSSVTLPDGKEMMIEFNVGEIIHIHIDDLRLTLSPEEFKELSAVVREGANDLEDVKDGL